MAAVTEVLDADLSQWVPGTRLFSTSEGQYFVIDADLGDYPIGPNTWIRRATVVLYCNPDGTVSGLTPDHVFPPGTTAEDAISDLGHTLEE
jgi:hypothetical protein